MPEETTTPPNLSKTKLSISLDFRLVILLLIGIIIAMTVIWKPWHHVSLPLNDRTISVAGDAKITAEPDEYTFNPSYEFKDTDKAAALAALTKKSDDIISKLKALGVPDANIKTGASGYDYYQYYYDSASRTNTYSLQLTVTANARAQAQKVQDYLVSTTPTGSVSPQVTFSDNKRKELEVQARDKATKEARAKADQSAKNLGFKVGAVKSVEDGSGFGNNVYYNKNNVLPNSALDSGSSQLTVQPGQNDLSYSVSVVYYLK